MGQKASKNTNYSHGVVRRQDTSCGCFTLFFNMDILLLVITQPFLINWAEIFYGNTGDYYSSIGYKRSLFWALFVIFDFLGRLCRCVKNGVAPQIPGASKPNQKVDPFGGLFGSPVISKSCFQLYWPWAPLKAERITNLRYLKII